MADLGIGEAAAIAASVIGAGATVYAASQTNTPKAIKPAVPTVDASISAADDALRRRQRQGQQANILTGNSGASNIAASSTGQKTLLGG